MPDRLTPADIQGRKLLNAVHIDYARGYSAWMGNVDGIPRLSAAEGWEDRKPFRRWYVDQKPVRDLQSALAVINGDMTLEAAMEPEQKPTKKYSLLAQIGEVKRELEQRAKVYPNLVRSHKMREGVAEYQTDVMKAVLATLEWLQASEADVRAYVAAKAEARKKATEGEAA